MPSTQDQRLHAFREWSSREEQKHVQSWWCSRRRTNGGENVNSCCASPSMMVREDALWRASWLKRRNLMIGVVFLTSRARRMYLCSDVYSSLDNNRNAHEGLCSLFRLKSWSLEFSWWNDDEKFRAMCVFLHSFLSLFLTKHTELRNLLYSC